MEQTKITETNDIPISVKFGCLEVMDNGLEYLQFIEERISSINDEKDEFIQAIQNDKLKHDDWYGWNGEKEVITPAYIYKPINFKTYHKSIRVADFDEAISDLVKRKRTRYYKCKCKKCGKIRYYTFETLQTNPPYCLRPMYCSSSNTYSVSTIHNLST